MPASWHAFREQVRERTRRAASGGRDQEPQPIAPVHQLRFSHARGTASATIAFMAKFKPARGKKGRAGAPPAAALPCVILILVGMALVMLFLYFVLRSSNS